MDPKYRAEEGLLPIFPLPGIVLLPHAILPVRVFEPRYQQMVGDSLAAQGIIGVVRIMPGHEEEAGGNPPVEQVGCAGRMTEIQELSGGRYDLKLVGARKFEILEEIQRHPYRTTRVKWVDDLNEDARGDAAKRAVDRIMSVLLRITRERDPEHRPPKRIPPGTSFGEAVNRIAVSARLDPDDLQGLLELRDVYARARRIERIVQKRATARRYAKRHRALITKNPAMN